jgi:predicted transcriptional regulator
MVNNQSAQLDAVFHALADPTRRAIIARLAQAPCGISELAAPFDMTLAAISKHIKVLKGVITPASWIQVLCSEVWNGCAIMRISGINGWTLLLQC